MTMKTNQATNAVASMRSLRAERQNLEQRLTAARTELNEVESRPVPLEVAIAHVNAKIDGWAAEYERRLAADLGQVYMLRRYNTNHFEHPFRGSRYDEILDKDALVFFMRDEIKTKIAAMLRARDYTNALDDTARAAQKQKLESEIVELEAAREELVRDLQALAEEVRRPTRPEVRELAHAVPGLSNLSPSSTVAPPRPAQTVGGVEAALRDVERVQARLAADDV